MNAEEKLDRMRHSAAHIMAEAVQSLFPEAKFGIGPTIENGFYYDFDLPRALTPGDLTVIEDKMKEIIQADLPFTREEVNKEEARRLFATQPYKLELIDELPDTTMTIYKQGSFTDLCRGPHVASTGEVKALKEFTVWRFTTKQSLRTIYLAKLKPLNATIESWVRSLTSSAPMRKLALA
jgi:threonyl-tRNA synthetase